MLSLFNTILIWILLITTIHTRSVPPNVRSFYNKVKNKPCTHPIKTGFRDGHGNSGITYCGDHKGLVYLTGDMDVGCDGFDNTEGKCTNDPSGQSNTAFQDTVRQHGISDLKANIHSYIVFGNTGATPSFNPQSVGMKPLSVMLVVCNNQLFYGVWGDTNHGVETGEASISLATACFPRDSITADQGHTDHDVLYIGFTGKGTIPGKRGAKWRAKSFKEFEASLARIGDKLVKRV
ncbi:hypothetical protein ASPWEDRAFT_34863 [Aspergillus wentii DTO 134E9]|uniref:Endo-chitosanase n=1 Tax=Aspergillus wentii DTO 134E9 TaxID=1073089 RepID=A0A1L9S2G4_ASPWE|nr:uncharacterized protein ASPWEDRAFT_34863 [Aspergillus wentii DTO 134E9]KAI9924389.1 hypothetical protein MW887_007015 [Aspergillus wentii]OJJ41344.1 hypothetical protein ASPWEDRAFT_34863 [Aspergillus wentii DTO 134E9]